MAESFRPLTGKLIQQQQDVVVLAGESFRPLTGKLMKSHVWD